MRPRLVFLVLACALLAGCQANVKLFTDASDPLNEQVVEGAGPGKVLLLPLEGVLSDRPREGIVRSMPSVMQDVASRLKLAARDKDVRAVVLRIDSPGGSTTASDMLYHEIEAFKEKTGAKVVACMMDVAASGGYYAALPADLIVAHPTTVTGSVGVVFFRPDLSGLMNLVGVKVAVSKTGEHKDMGSPFRPSTVEEERIIQGIISAMNARFLELVQKHRRLSPEALSQVATARVFGAAEALKLGLVDRVGYLDEAVAEAKRLADLPETAKVVTYRRTAAPDDTLYNVQARTPAQIGLVSLESLGVMPPQAGFHYIWLPQP